MEPNLELIPVIFGAFVGLIGLGLVFDAWTPDEILVKRERRRKARIERSRGGEAMVGLGVLCMAGAFIGRDTWVYSVIAVIVGAVLLLMGTVANRKYLGELIGNRGALRRRG
ncbi:MAG: hypothetical protein ABIR92_01625 [Gemmatimonadaceae bacterium]